MTRNQLPTRVPCAVCLATIVGWSADGRAQPCGCSLEAIERERQAAEVRRGEVREDLWEEVGADG